MTASDWAYGELLDSLRKDLLLDPTTDLLQHSMTDTNFAPANIDGAAATPSLRTLGTGAQQAPPGNRVLFTRVGGLEIVIGTSTVTWPGANKNSNGTTQAHGLGRTPALAVVTCKGNNSVGIGCIAWLFGAGWDGTNILLAARTSDDSTPAAGTTVTVAWAAIG